MSAACGLRFDAVVFDRSFPSSAEWKASDFVARKLHSQPMKRLLNALKRHSHWDLWNEALLLAAASLHLLLRAAQWGQRHFLEPLALIQSSQVSHPLPPLRSTLPVIAARVFKSEASES